MRPDLIRFSESFVIHAYPGMLAIAFLVGTLLTSRASQRQDPPLYIPPQIGVVAFFGALIGARVFWILQYSELRHLWQAVLIWQGGLVYYGGLGGGLLAVAVYLRVMKLPMRRAMDVIVPHLALGQGITRVGCFLNGCCWGVPCTLSWAVTFPKGSHAFKQQRDDGLIHALDPEALPVHPTQLYMVVGLTAIFVVLRWRLKRVRVPGMNTALYMLLYGALRFIVEAYRGDSARSVYGLTVSQAVSLSFIAVAAAIILGRFTWFRTRTDTGTSQGPENESKPSDSRP